MNVVVSPSRGDDGNVNVGSDAIQVAEKSGNEIFRNRRSALFGAEDAMNQDIRIGVRHKCRPFGTRSSWAVCPGLTPRAFLYWPFGPGFCRVEIRVSACKGFRPNSGGHACILIKSCLQQCPESVRGVTTKLFGFVKRAAKPGNRPSDGRAAKRRNGKARHVSAGKFGVNAKFRRNDTVPRSAVS